MNHTLACGGVAGLNVLIQSLIIFGADTRYTTLTSILEFQEAQLPKFGMNFTMTMSLAGLGVGVLMILVIVVTIVIVGKMRAASPNLPGEEPDEPSFSISKDCKEWCAKMHTPESWAVCSYGKCACLANFTNGPSQKNDKGVCINM